MIAALAGHEGVAIGQPVELVGGHVEEGVVHLERREDARRGRIGRAASPTRAGRPRRARRSTPNNSTPRRARIRAAACASAATKPSRSCPPCQFSILPVAIGGIDVACGSGSRRSAPRCGAADRPSASAARSAWSGTARAPPPPRYTPIPLNSGRTWWTGVSTATMPSSTSIMNAIEVIGLVMLAMRNSDALVDRLAAAFARRALARKMDDLAVARDQQLERWPACPNRGTDPSGTHRSASSRAASKPVLSGRFHQHRSSIPSFLSC